MKPNVILIIADQMRRDCIGVMGHDVVETPNLDAMKKNGHMFTRAYSSVPSCIAARAAIMTGLSQRNHGRVGYRDDVTWNYETTMAGEFSKAGYHTQCVGKMHVAPSRNLVGYHNVVLHDGYLHYSRNRDRPGYTAFEQTDDYLCWLKSKKGFDADLTDFGMECNSWTARPWGYPEEMHPTNWVVTESIDFLRRRDPTKPFFLTASFVRPHSPLDPPQVYYDMYINQPFLPPLMGEWAEREDPDQEALDANCSRGILHEKALHRARAAYYGMITHIDHQIGRLFQALGEHNALKNSVILFVSDHGDLLGDHNLFRKSLPYEGSAGVPFILYDPGKLLGESQNRTYDHVTELRDIMPTLLDAAGLKIPDSLDGISVLPILKDKKAPWREYIHGEHAGDKKIANHYITDGKMKYLWFSGAGREQFFDLTKDPGELDDLIMDDRYRSHIERFRSYLIHELNGREEGYTDGKRLISGRKPHDVLATAGLL